MSKTLPLLLFLLLSSALFAQTQTPAFTESTVFACNYATCNGAPLDGGGTWQFIRTNGAFAISTATFYIYGNPGNPSTTDPTTGRHGGISNLVSTVPMPPCIGCNGSVGAEGTFTFDWAAVDATGTLHYTGNAVVEAHYVRKCVRPPRGSPSCGNVTVINDASIFIDSVN